MGYRSEVCIAVYGEPLALIAHVTKWKASINSNETLGWVLHSEVDHDEEGMYRLEFHYVKWYDDYVGVEDVMRLLESLDGSELGNLTGEFVRTGENDDDIERRFYGNKAKCAYKYQVSREIVFE